MGAFYGNITLKGTNQEKVTQALYGRRAIITPTIGDYTVAFDSVCDEQNIDGIQALTSRLSHDLQCYALAIIVHDDDVFGYFLYQNGALTDWYNSRPNYFDFDSTKKPTNPVGGNVDKLCVAFGVDSLQEIESILRKPSGINGYAFETKRHSDLVRVLQLPDFTVGNALANFDRGEYPEKLSAKQMLRAADPPPLEDRQRKLDREFYSKLGAEDLSRPCKKEGCSRGAILNSVMCKRHHFEMIQRRDCPF